MGEQSGRLDLIQRAAKRLSALDGTIAAPQPTPVVDASPESAMPKPESAMLKAAPTRDMPPLRTNDVAFAPAKPTEDIPRAAPAAAPAPAAPAAPPSESRGRCG